MFRHSIARRLTTLACLCAMAAYSGWAFTNTVANPAMSEDLTRSLMSRPAVLTQLGGGAAAYVPILQQAGLGPDVAHNVVTTVFEDERVVDAVSSTVAGVHQDLIAGAPELRAHIPGDVLTSATRDAAEAHGADPSVIPDLPGAEIALPSTTALSTVNHFAQRWGQALGVAAAILAAALLVSDHRPMVTRQVGRWMVFSSGFSLIGATLASHFTQSSDSMLFATAGGVAGVWRSYTQPVLLVVLVAGVALWCISAAVLSGAVADAVDRFRRGGGVPLTGSGQPSGEPGSEPPTLGSAQPQSQTFDSHRSQHPDYDPWIDGAVVGGRYTRVSNAD